MFIKQTLILLLLTIYITKLNAQNEEQQKWLESIAAEKDLFIQSNLNNIHLKSTSNIIEIDGYELDHGDELTTGGTLSPDGTGLRTTHNVHAAARINATNVIIPSLPSFPALNGDGVSILLFDAGRPRVDHEAFGTRVFVPLQDLIISGICTYELVEDEYPSSKRHASIVTGTLVSNSNNDAKGLASGAQVIAYDWDYTKSYLAMNALEGANIACIPYGYAAGWDKIDGNAYWFGKYGDKESYLFGFYSKISKVWDDIAWNAPYLLIVKSAGNEFKPTPVINNNESYKVCTASICSTLCDWGSAVYTNGEPYQDGHKNYDCLSDFAVSKNLLVIGAVDANGNIVSTSGRGPTDDMRIKPDLVAKGNNLFSTINTGYKDYGQSDIGTSYAVGSVAGGAALLLQEQLKLYGAVRFLSSTLKGILLHTATDMGTAGPDYMYGWGIPDINKSSELIDANYSNHKHIHEFTITHGDQVILFKVKKKDAAKDLKVTICWNDPSGTPPPVSLNPTTPVLVNDIDLRINRVTDNNAYLPWKINPSNPNGAAIKGDNAVDNVEQIIISDNSVGEYLVKIYPKNGNLPETQVVSVIVSGNDPSAIVNDLTINTLTIGNTNSYEAINSISCENILIQNTAKLQLIAGNSIKLKIGFKVNAGALFKASRSENFYSVFGQSIPFRNNIPWVNVDDLCNNSPKIEFDELTEINSDLSKYDKILNVFPNPSNGEFIINFRSPEQISSVEILNISGQSIYKKNQNISNSEKISISLQQDGLYLIKIQSNNKSVVLKHLKKSK